MCGVAVRLSAKCNAVKASFRAHRGTGLGIVVPGYASLPACSLRWYTNYRPAARFEPDAHDCKQYSLVASNAISGASDSDQCVIRRDCALEAMRTQGFSGRAHANTAARPALRRANVAEESELHVDRRLHIGARHRGQHGHLRVDG